MKIRFFAALIASKLIMIVCRAFGRGGTSLPGKIALAIYPAFLGAIAAGFRVVMVTGTNGKTTTTGIISRILKENGIWHVTNKSGSNLIGGVTSAFIEAMDFTGRYSVDTAVLEVDEAALYPVTDFIEPDILVVTNFFRDQLDRYGELYSALKRVADSVCKTKKTSLILNADDSLCASLGVGTDRTVLYYGFSPFSASIDEENENPDAVYCLYCKAKYMYTYRTYGHFGGFYCPVCGYSRPNSDISCTGIVGLENDYSIIEASLAGLPDVCTIYVNIPGKYNIYNALAGAACGQMLGLPVRNTINALSKLECSFGRMETVQVSGKKIRLVLVKNPAGLNQVLSSMLTGEDRLQLAFAINDRFADGTDISWLWDVNFEILQGIQDRIGFIYACGTRCDDMAVRLKYAGISADKIASVNNYDELIQNGLSRMDEGYVFYILPTYTAMHDVRGVLKKMYKLKELWE